MSFEHYAAAGFTTELLPILPPDAQISPASPQRENLEASRGKVPGKRQGDHWFGFSRWAQYSSNESDVATWTRWSSGIGLQARKLPGLDIDVEQGEVADAIEISALFELGMAPTRFGRGARRLLVYSGAGFKKRRLAFRLPGGDEAPAAGHVGGAAGGDDRRQDDLLAEGHAQGAGSPADPGLGAALGGVQAVELLAEGQQYVVEGVHPKTGRPYWWRDDESPAATGAADLVEITAAELDAFFESLEWYLVEVLGAEIVENARGSTGGRDADVWQDGLAAPSLDAVARALNEIPNGEA